MMLGAALFALLAAPALADNEFPATLAGHAILPAMTLIDAPADAPATRTGPTTTSSCCWKSGSF